MAPAIEVTIPAGQGAPATPAYAILPAGARAGVVVIHEIFGRQPEIDRAVARLADAGYAAVAPDLFHRGKLACLRDTFQAMRSGDGIGAQQGRNARAWLCEQTGIPQDHVGLVGFCFGGGFALTAGAGWAAVSANYGHLPRPEAMRDIGPLAACYGSRDKTLTKAPAVLRDRLATMGHAESEVHVFDAGHSFLTDGKPRLLSHLVPLGVGNYPEAREAGWKKILAFFEHHLG